MNDDNLSLDEIRKIMDREDDDARIADLVDEAPTPRELEPEETGE